MDFVGEWWSLWGSSGVCGGVMEFVAALGECGLHDERGGAVFITPVNIGKLSQPCFVYLSPLVEKCGRVCIR